MWFIWKITIAVMMVTHTTQAASILCYSGSITNFKELPLTSIGSLLNTAFLPAGCELTVVIPGREALFNDDISNLLSNQISQPASNKCYCSLNWISDITGGFGTPLDDLTNPADAVEDILNPNLGLNDLPTITTIGNSFFDALNVLRNGGLDLAKLHLIGVSEGALLAGLAGQALKNVNVVIARITGLNPASVGLQKGDANLVDCIQTINGFLSAATCDIIFYVNHGCKVQPGCTPSIIPIKTDFCSRKRAISLLAEAFAKPDSLQGWKASSFNKWLQSTGSPPQNEINKIGPNINPSLLGSFFLATSSSAPFGKGIDGSKPSSSSCVSTIL